MVTQNLIAELFEVGRSTITEHNNNILKDGEHVFYLNCSPNEWIVPANPKCFDVIGHLEKEKRIEWKQSSAIHEGDIVYIYVGSLIFCILYRLRAIKVNIPSKYQDENIKTTKVMELERIKQYQEGTISFEKLKS